MHGHLPDLRKEIQPHRERVPMQHPRPSEVAFTKAHLPRGQRPHSPHSNTSECPISRTTALSSGSAKLIFVGASFSLADGANWSLCMHRCNRQKRNIREFRL